MNTSLEGRVALITGATLGIGRAIALELGRERAHVVCCARDAGRLDGLIRELDRSGASASSIPMDIRSLESVKHALSEVGERFGALDILVNNAGGAPRFGGLDDLTDSDWLDAYDLNVVGPVRVIREALPLLRKSADARVINLSSLSGMQPGGYNPHYAAAKAALINFSKYVADFLAKEGILVTTVCPGPVHSDAWDRNIEHVAAQRNIDVEAAREAVEREEAAKVPIGRVGAGDDIAGLVAFLASSRASYITGTCIVVDGGKYRAAF